MYNKSNIKFIILASSEKFIFVILITADQQYFSLKGRIFNY